MKKIITGTVLLTMLVLCTSLSVGAVVYGDANRDGNVDITDLIALKKYCSGYSVNIEKIKERFKDNTDFEIVTMRGIGYKVDTK